MRLWSVIAVAIVSIPSVAGAGSGCESGHDPVDMVQYVFDEADRDRDGSLDRAEYEAAGLQGFGVTFDESDANSDGVTTMKEYLELYLRHHPAKGGSEA